MTRAKVRRERMGHIELAAPVSHIWYFKGIPSRMGLILDISPRALEKVLYFAYYIVLDPGETELTKKSLLSEKDYHEALEKYGRDLTELARKGKLVEGKRTGRIEIEFYSANDREVLLDNLYRMGNSWQDSSKQHR